MDIAKLNPWNWFKREDEGKTLPVQGAQTGSGGASAHPLESLHGEIDRMFDRAFRGFGFDRPFFGPGSLFARGDEAFKPRVDIAGTETEYTITAELPGVEEKDITLELNGDALIIRGEKQQEQESKDKGYYSVERSYGSFQRVLTVPADADTEGIKAAYKNGVVTVTLPRKKALQDETRKIEIES